MAVCIQVCISGWNDKILLLENETLFSLAILSASLWLRHTGNHEFVLVIMTNDYVWFLLYFSCLPEVNMSLVSSNSLIRFFKLSKLQQQTRSQEANDLVILFYSNSPFSLRLKTPFFSKFSLIILNSSSLKWLLLFDVAAL